LDKNKKSNPKKKKVELLVNDNEDSPKIEIMNSNLKVSPINKGQVPKLLLKPNLGRESQSRGKASPSSVESN